MFSPLMMVILPIVLIVFSIPLFSSLNILINFRTRKELFNSLYLFSYFIFLIQLFIQYASLSGPSFLTSKFFLFCFMVLNISFYFLHKPIKFKKIDYFLIFNVFLLSILNNILNLFGFDYEVFMSQYSGFVTLNVGLVFLHYVVKSFQGEVDLSEILKTRFMFKFLVYIYHSVLFTSLLVVVFNENTFISTLSFGYSFIALIAVSVLFVIDLYVKYFSFKPVEKVTVEDGYSKSHLSNVDLEKLEKDLENVMVNEKIFKDTMLTLKKLALSVDVSAHQLSEFLNNNKNVSFSQYLMTYRVEEAKELLVKYDWRTTMSIGFEVGFNSHSSFGRCFKLITGESPGAYRAKLNK